MSVRVLVVDDVADIRRLIGAIIAAHDRGWSVAGEASNGEEAITAARLLDPDLVLLDLSMPVMDGLEALPTLRTSAPDAAVVMLTGFPSDVAKAAAMAAGADGYLEKEALVSTLIQRLQAIIDDLGGTAGERA